MTSQDEKLGELTAHLKFAHNRIDALETEVKDQRKFADAVGRVDERMKSMEKNLDDVNQLLREVAGRPSRWWDKLIIAVISTLSSGIAAAVLGAILK